LDLVLVMTVNPGFGGQDFIAAMVPKIRQVRDMLQGRDIELQVDGGIHPETIGIAARAGANAFVAGSAVFATSDYARNIKALRTAATATVA
jgi:ribulose-phosphate 3-epimerase